MSSRIRNHVAAAFLLMPVAATLMSLPGTAQAQRAAPQIESFDVASDNGLAPGAQLRFTVEGDPRAQVTLRIRGVDRMIVLKEANRGVYTGVYTIRRSDRITDQSAIRAFLRARNVTTSTAFEFPPDIDRPVVVRPPRVEPPPVALPPPPPLRIERFSVVPVDRLEPGAELRFTVNGAPGARVEFDIPGVVQDVPMSEVRPGVYEGEYTIRRNDNFAPSRPIVATLRIGDRVVTQALNQPLVGDVRPPVTAVPLLITSHPNNAQIPAGTTSLQGRTLPGATVDVRVVASASVIGLGVNQELLSQRVQADGNGNFSFSFTPQYALPNARYEVQMVSNRGNLRAESTLVLFQR